MASHGFEAAVLGWLFACGPAVAVGQIADLAPPAATAPASGPVPASTCCVIPAGTVVVVELTEPLSDRSAKAGDRFGLRLAEPITVDGRVLAPAGAVGFGEVIDAKPANIGGRPGRLVLAARYLDSGPVRLKLQTFKLGGGGRDNSGLAVGATIAVGLVGVLVPGGGVEYPAGTRATAKIAADVPIQPSGDPAPAPSPAPPSSP